VESSKNERLRRDSLEKKILPRLPRSGRASCGVEEKPILFGKRELGGVGVGGGGVFVLGGGGGGGGFLKGKKYKAVELVRG